MKRLILIALCLSVLFLPISGAIAEDSRGIAYGLPQGAVEYAPRDIMSAEIPSGLEGMYAMMQKADEGYMTLVFRMKNGRALASIGISAVPVGMTTDALFTMWQSIAKTLSNEMVYVNADESCAVQDEKYGRKVLSVKTNGVVGDDGTLLLDIGCTAFIEQDMLIEIWTAAPSDTAYLFDEAANAELEADKLDIETLLNNFNFNSLTPVKREITKPDIAYETEHYTDPKGRFETDVIKGCKVITAESDAGEAQALRDALVSKYGEGAGTLYDISYADVLNEDATYFTLPDLSGAVVIYRVHIDGMENMTVDDLLLNNVPTTDSLRKKFGDAYCMYSDGRLNVSGTEHAWTAYWLRSGQTDMLLDLMAVIDEGGSLRELDMFRMTDDKSGELCEALLYTVVNTIVYSIPDANP